MMTITATTLDHRPYTAPTFPASLGELTNTPLAAQYGLIARNLDTLRKAYTKHTRWLEACTLHALDAADAPSLRTMPSKAAKHRMYDTAAALTRACGWDPAATRCHSLDDIAVLIATVESLLRR